MTTPFTTVTEQDPNDAGRLYLPMARSRGKLLIVRPLKYQAEGFVTIHKPEGTDVVFADIAILDEIPAGQDEYGEALPGFAAGSQFREQSVLQGYLKGTFKRYIGGTLLGTIYFGPKEKGKPPMKWQDLTTDANCAARGQQWLAAHPEFLVPVQAAFVAAVPEPVAPAGPPAYVPPAAAAAYGYDPHTQQQQPVSVPPVQGGSTLDQLRRMGAVNAQGQPQATDVPF